MIDLIIHFYLFFLFSIGFRLVKIYKSKQKYKINSDTFCLPQSTLQLPSDVSSCDEHILQIGNGMLLDKIHIYRCRVVPYVLSCAPENVNIHFKLL